MRRREGTAGGDRPVHRLLEWENALRAGRLPTAIEAEVQVLTLGDTPLVPLPRELFVEFGLAIKERAGDDRLRERYARLYPPRSAYPQGGYEVAEAFRYYDYPAPFAPEAGEALVEAALALLAD